MDGFVCIFVGLSFLCWLGGWAVTVRFRGVPQLVHGADALDPEITLSIIIPARNEEENLGRLLPSVREQEWTAHEIIVVDDRSEDATAALAREHGAMVVEGRPLPEGWYGKPWACTQGAEAASGDWLLFLDADTVLQPGGLRRIASLSRQREAVHSICPYHVVRKPYEQLSAFFNVIMLIGTNAFTWKGSEAREIGLFGQSLFLSRKQYEAVGGHEPVKREVLENFQLSRHFGAAGFRRQCYLGRGVISMRMFPDGWRQLVAGWSKGFLSGAASTPRSALVGTSLWLSGLIMGAIAVTFLPLVSTSSALLIGGFYVACLIQCLVFFRKAGGFRFLTAALYPVALAFYLVVFFGAALRKKKGGTIQWKGRDVD